LCRSNLFLLSSMSTSTPSISPLSLHDALPIYPCGLQRQIDFFVAPSRGREEIAVHRSPDRGRPPGRRERAAGRRAAAQAGDQPRSEEHTSELQSRENLVCRLLLEKKNQDL